MQITFENGFCGFSNLHRCFLHIFPFPKIPSSLRLASRKYLLSKNDMWILASVSASIRKSVCQSVMITGFLGQHPSLGVEIPGIMKIKPPPGGMHLFWHPVCINFDPVYINLHWSPEGKSSFLKGAIWDYYRFWYIHI